MNQTFPSRIVVGVALAAVFGAGVYVYGVRGNQQPRVAQATPAPPPPPAVAQPPAPQIPDALAAEANNTAQPPSEPTNVTPPATSPNVAQNATPADNAAPATPQALTPKRHKSTRSSDGSSDPGPASASNTGVQPATGNSDSAGSVTSNAANAPNAPDATAAAPTAPAAAPSAADAPASDSKISADVRTEIATATPNSNVNVTTTNGAVALAGSVPNQDAANQAKQAAMSVAGVKTVDTSGLLVSNQ